LERVNPKCDVRRERRALTTAKAARRSAETRFGPSRPKRVLAYELVLTIGLRWFEIRPYTILTAGGFALDGASPTSTV